MKTFAETRGELPFDWNAFLNKKKHDSYDWFHAEWLAKSWVTCACGNQCHIIPRERRLRRSADGAPKDYRLLELGKKFYGAICEKRIGEAKEILAKIEIRSAELIQFIQHQKNNQ